MSEYDPKSVLTFEKDHSLRLGMTQEQVAAQVAANTNPTMPLIEMRDAQGNPVLVNALAITFVSDDLKSRETAF